MNQKLNSKQQQRETLQSPNIKDTTLTKHEK